MRMALNSWCTRCSDRGAHSAQFLLHINKEARGAGGESHCASGRAECARWAGRARGEGRASSLRMLLLVAPESAGEFVSVPAPASLLCPGQLKSRKSDRLD